MVTEKYRVTPAAASIPDSFDSFSRRRYPAFHHLFFVGKPSDDILLAFLSSSKMPDGV